MNRNVTPDSRRDRIRANPLDRAPVELGGRLVQDDEPRAVRECTGDLHELALLDPEPLGRHAYVDVDLPGVQQVPGPSAQGAPGDQPVTLPVQEEILRDR